MAISWYSVAIRHSGAIVTTAAIDNLQFQAPAYEGDMVAIDSEGRPVEVPDLFPETEEEKQEQQAAIKRKALRKQRRQEGF